MDVSNLILIIENLYETYGYPILFLISFIETSPMGWAVPGGLIVALGGFFAYGQGLSLALTLVSAWLGMWTTFLITYFLGKKFGNNLVRKFGQEKNARRARVLLERHGPTILTTSLLANLTRFWVAFVAGSQNYGFLRFLFYSSVASLTWTSLLVTVGYLAGAERGNIEAGLARLGLISWGLVLLVIALIYWHTRQEFEEYQDGEGEE